MCHVYAQLHNTVFAESAKVMEQRDHAVGSEFLGEAVIDIGQHVWDDVTSSSRTAKRKKGGRLARYSGMDTALHHRTTSGAASTGPSTSSNRDGAGGEGHFRIAHSGGFLPSEVPPHLRESDLGLRILTGHVPSVDLMTEADSSQQQGQGGDPLGGVTQDTTGGGKRTMGLTPLCHHYAPIDFIRASDNSGGAVAYFEFEWAFEVDDDPLLCLGLQVIPYFILPPTRLPVASVTLPSFLLHCFVTPPGATVKLCFVGLRLPATPAAISPTARRLDCRTPH